MRVLVLHSLVAEGAPPEEMDTIIAAKAVSDALQSRGHDAPLAAFTENKAALEALLARHRTEVVFNLVEGIDGQGRLAYIAPRMLDAAAMPYTGTGPEGLIVTLDKPLTKRMLRGKGLPTPDWSEPPGWEGLKGGLYIVKCADEDSSIGLDDASVVEGHKAPARAAECAARWGGRWFAERYIEGREFNVGLLEEGGRPRVLPMAEMTFEGWPAGRPRIVGYSAKWDERSFESRRTVRRFGVEEREPPLARALAELAKKTWDLFGLAGFVRVDFRVGETGEPQILEINPNPCIAPDGGFAMAAERGGMSYAETIERIVLEAVK